MPKPLSTSPLTPPCIGVFGPAGSGKTSLMMRFKFPGKKTYIIDGDGKLRGPKLMLKKEGLDDSHIVFDRIQFDDDDKPVPQLLQYLRLAKLLATAAVAKDDKGDFPYGLIGITSTTALKDIFMNEVRRQLGKGTDYQFQIQDWGKYEALWTYFIMEVLKSLPCTSMIDGHQEPEKGQMDQVLRLAIAIPGRTGNLLPARLTDMWIAKSETVIEGGKLRSKYSINTVATQQNLEINTGLDLPPSFEVTQAMVDSIVQQIVGTKQTTPTT